MDSLFGIPLTSILVGLLILVGVSLAVLVWIAWRQPLLTRMGLRNIRRRAAQTTLIVSGLMLSTLIVSAAFATGDTVGYSITNELYRQLEEVDFLVAFEPDPSLSGRPADETDVDAFEEIRAEFANDPEIDGITATIVRQLPVLNREQRLSEPAAMVVGVDPQTVAPFRGLRAAADGSLVPADALTGDSVYISGQLADAVDAGGGDAIEVFFEGEPHRFEVLAVIRDTSVVQQGNTQAGGVVMHIERMRELTGEPGELSNVAISIAGGVRDTLDRSDGVQDRIEAFLDANPHLGAEIEITKAELIGFAELAGSIFVTLFLGFGLFSIAAGILLIFLIFVMLAAERRSEMGMARAIGMTRLHLTETFIAEGMAYNIGSALVGALLGLVVAYGLVTALGSLFADAGFGVVFHFSWQGFIIAYSAGIVVTFATVAFASWRAANLNIVRAIRDLPEPQPFGEGNASTRALLAGSVAALWYVVWIAMTVLLGLATFQLFLLSLAFYGLPLLIVFPLGALYVFGARAAARPLRATRGWWRRAIYVLWWIVFSLVALVTWFLLRTKGWSDRRRNSGGWALLMLIAGVVLIWLGGWVWHQLFAYTSGTTLLVIALAMLSVYYGAAARTAFTIAGAALVWYWLLPLPFSLLFEAGEGYTDPVAGLLGLFDLEPDPMLGNIEMFFVSGVSITAASTMVVIFNADRLLAVVGMLGRLLGGLTPALRTAIAYPLAAKFRTAMTLSMFTLVVFSLVVMAFINFNFSQLFLGEGATAGFDVVARSNPDNRFGDLREALQAAGAQDTLEQITGVGTVTSTFPGASARDDAPADGEALRVRLNGGDPEFFELARMPLEFRAAGFESDEAVFEAVRSDPSLVIATDNLLARSGQFGPQQGFSLRQRPEDLEGTDWAPIPLTLREPESGTEREVRVVGIIEPQVTGLLFTLTGLYSTRDAVLDFTDGGGVENYYVTTAADAAANREIAREIESALLERGVQADSIHEMLQDATAQSTGFQLLFEAFMGLGLVVGIAALGVIAFRTVVERRQQIGMLRAIGYSRRMIGASFFFESSFIALVGIGMGVLLGGLLSFNLLSDPEQVGAGGAEIDFQIPWLRLLLIGGIAYGASALMTLIPARSASHVAVAEALRYE